MFQSQDVYDFTIHEIKVVWKKRKSESFNKYWDWVKAFYQVDQVETLLLIKERIDNTEKVELSVDEIDVNEGKTIKVSTMNLSLYWEALQILITLSLHLTCFLITI